VREIKIRAMPEEGKQILRLAFEEGIGEAATHEVFLQKKGAVRLEINIKTSTPLADRFVRRLLEQSFFDRRAVSLSSHELKSLIDEESMEEITRPTPIPAVDLFQDLWQNSHITIAFLSKVTGSALLLAYAMLTNDLILMVGSLLFTPFTPLLLSVSFGICAKDKHLIRQGAIAFAVGTAITIACAYLLAAVTMHPLEYQRFGTPLTNVLVSVAAGFIAGFTDADDVGRRQIIAMAATFPYVKFPIWIGVCLAGGFPDRWTTEQRFFVFPLNVLIIVLTSALAYKVLGIEGKRFSHFVPVQRAGREKAS
jgi:hypothetical protein